MEPPLGLRLRESSGRGVSPSRKRISRESSYRMIGTSEIEISPLTALVMRQEASRLIICRSIVP